MTHYTPDRAFECSNCCKVFKTKGELDNHERMHRGEKPFKCEVCGKACSNETQLSKAFLVLLAYITLMNVNSNPPPNSYGREAIPVRYVHILLR